MTNTTNSGTVQRGARYEGGIYVGTTKSGVEWVARATRTQTEAEAFAFLCARFDRLEKPALGKLTKVPQSVIECAEDLAEAGAEAFRGYHAKVTPTTITARLSFFADLAEDLRELAKQREMGELGMAQRALSDVDPRFAEAADKRFAKSLRKWAKRCDRLAGA